MLSHVEDEIHFLTECPAFSVERNVFFNRISEMCKNFTSMSDFQKFIWFSNENANVLRVFAQFVYDCYCKRFELLSRKWVSRVDYEFLEGGIPCIVCSCAAWVSMWLSGLVTGWYSGFLGPGMPRFCYIGCCSASVYLFDYLAHWVNLIWVNCHWRLVPMIVYVIAGTAVWFLAHLSL